MTQQADLEETEHGFVPASDGWFVVNVADAVWKGSERYGTYCGFEGELEFPHFGINIHVIQPGQPNGMYHCEEAQEDFLVLHGECLLLVEEQERLLKQWDFFHAAPNTKHNFIGAGKGPCAILMVGHRDPNEKILYPRSELALEHGAGVEVETPSPKVAYADRPPWRPASAPPPFA